MSWFGWGKKEESPESAQDAQARPNIPRSPAQQYGAYSPAMSSSMQAPQSTPSASFGADDLFSGMDIMTSNDSPAASSSTSAIAGVPSNNNQSSSHASQAYAAAVRAQPQDQTSQVLQGEVGNGEVGDAIADDNEDGSAFGFLASDDDSEPEPQAALVSEVATAAYGGLSNLSGHFEPNRETSTSAVLSANPEAKVSDDSLSLFADMNEVQQIMPAIVSSPVPDSKVTHVEPEINQYPSQNVVDTNVQKLSASLSAVIESIYESVQGALAERSKLAQLTIALDQAELAIKEAQEEQERAAEEDEFERADALNAVIESLKSRAEAIREERSKYETHLEGEAESARHYADSQAPTERSDDDKFLALSDISLNSFNAAFAIAAQLRGKVSDVFSHEQRMQKEDVEDERRALEAKLKKEVDSVKIDHAHAKNAIHHLDEELASIDAEMSKIRQDEADETAEETTLQSKLSCECMGLEAEVTELERLLAIKKREWRSKVDELEECGQRISTIRSSFDRRVRKASDRKEQIEVEQKEAESTLKSLQLRAEQCLDSQIGIAVKDLSLELDRRRSERIETATTSQLMRLQTIASELNRSGAKFRILSSQAMGSRGAAWKDLESRLEAIDNEMNSLQITEAEHEALIATANLRIPVLNAEKKTAAASKNFKAAAALNKEISALNDEKAASEEELTRLCNAKENLQKERASVLEGLEEMNVKIREQESKRDLGIAMHYLDASTRIYSLKYEVDKSICAFKYLAFKDAEKMTKCKQGETVPSLDLPDFAGVAEEGNAATKRKSIEMDLFAADKVVISALETESSRLQSLASAYILEAKKLKERYEEWSLDVDVKEDEIDEEAIIKELEEQDIPANNGGEASQEFAHNDDVAVKATELQSDESANSNEEDVKEIVTFMPEVESERVEDEVNVENAEVVQEEAVDAIVEKSAEEVELALEPEESAKDGAQEPLSTEIQNQTEIDELAGEVKNDDAQVNDEDDDIMASFLEAAEQDENDENNSDGGVVESEVGKVESPAEDPEARKEELNQKVYMLREEAKECEEEIQRLASQVSDASNAEDYEQAEILNDKQSQKEARLNELQEEIESCLHELQKIE